MNLQDIRHLQIEPTTYCNARCPHCPRFDWKTGKERKDLKLDHWDIDVILPNINVSEMPNLKYVLIEGDKGDPLMHPRIDEIVSYFINAPSKPVVRLATNGSIRNTTWWSKLATENNSRLEVMFSIDGLEDTNHLYRVNVEYQKVIDNARAFIDAGGNAMWKCIAFKHNETQLEEIKETAKNYGFSRVHYRRCSNRFDNSNEQKVYVNGQVTHTISPPTLTRSEIKLLDEIFIDHNNNIELTEELGMVCPRMNLGWVYITFKGHLMPCCMFHNMMDDKNIFARVFRKKIATDSNLIDLTKHNIKDVLNNSGMIERMEENISDPKNRLMKCQAFCISDIERALKSDKYTNVS